VAQAPGGTHLLDEAGGRVGRGVETCPEDLQGHRAPETDVLGAVDQTVATAPDQRPDEIAAEATSRSEHGPISTLSRSA
jgi:hypothetical protein